MDLKVSAVVTILHERCFTVMFRAPMEGDLAAKSIWRMQICKVEREVETRGRWMLPPHWTRPRPREHRHQRSMGLSTWKHGQRTRSLSTIICNTHGS